METHLANPTAAALADHLAALDVLHRFAAGQDHQDPELFASAFSDDAILDFVQPASRLGVRLPPFEGKVGIVAAILASTAPLKTTHTVSNQRVALAGEAAELTALVEAMHVRSEDESRRLLLKNIYRCALVRRDGQWRARRIVIENVWFEGDPRVLFPAAS